MLEIVKTIGACIGIALLSMSAIMAIALCVNAWLEYKKLEKSADLYIKAFFSEIRKDKRKERKEE